MSEKLMQAMFNQQRLQILNQGIHYDQFSDAYLFAWAEGIYPLDIDSHIGIGIKRVSDPEECFDNVFPVTKAICLSVFEFIENIEEEFHTINSLKQELSNNNVVEIEEADLRFVLRYFILFGVEVSRESYAEGSYKGLCLQGSEHELDWMYKDLKRKEMKVVGCSGDICVVSNCGISVRESKKLNERL